MAAPQVQSVEQIISDYNPAFQGEIDVLNKRRTQLPQQFEAQRMGLEAQKVKGFNQINDQMNARGLAFGGIVADEQADYLSTHYLPGMQQLTFQQNEAESALDMSLAQIDKERRLSAFNVRESQQKTLENYLAEERDRAWQREKFQSEQAMERARLAQQASLAAQERQANTPTTYNWTKNKSGGYDVQGGVDLATAVKSQGGGISNLVSLLRNGSGSDRKAADYYMKTVGTDPVAAYNYLVNKTGAFYKGGGF